MSKGLYIKLIRQWPIFEEETQRQSRLERKALAPVGASARVDDKWANMSRRHLDYSKMTGI